MNVLEVHLHHQNVTNEIDTSHFVKKSYLKLII